MSYKESENDNITKDFLNNYKKIIKQFEKTYKHHIDVIDINMSGICEKCLEKKAA